MRLAGRTANAPYNRIIEFVLAAPLGVQRGTTMHQLSESIQLTQLVQRS